jgi:hypothetical protein
MNKTTLISTINGFITAVMGTIKHRNSMLPLVDEMFPTKLNQTISTGAITCNLDYKKCGNEARVSGSITNNTSSLIGDGLIEIPDPIYYAKTGTQTRSQLNNGITLQISDTDINLFGVLGANETIYINESYQIND